MFEDGDTGEEPDPAYDGEATSRDAVVEIVARCLERVDAEGDEAIEAVCLEHPEHAQAIRDRLSVLRRLGLAQPRLEEERPFGRYVLLRELGRGGMGVVYLARDPVVGRLVALKALGQRLVASDRARSRFEREFRAIAQLEHPRIVPVYDVGEIDGVPFFTMQYVEGRTLGDILRTLRNLAVPMTELNTTHLSLATFTDTPAPLSGSKSAETSSGDGRDPDEPWSDDPLTRGPGEEESAAPPLGTPVPALPSTWGKTYVETICRLVLDVAEALAHAHAQGVIHRDVKPSNVLIRRDGRACLFDFGLARVETDEALTLTGDFAGTPFYVSPEQARGHEVDCRSDVYSLGATLYELLTLRRPFDGKSAQAVFRQILTREALPPRQANRLVPRDLETICLTALEKDSAKRYQTAGELADDLRRFLDFQPIRARPIGAAERGWRWVRRNPLPATLVGLVFLGLTGGIAGLAWANRAIAAEARRAETALEEARTTSSFLSDVLRSVDPSDMGYDVTVRDVLDEMDARIGTQFADQPAVEASLRETIGDTYYEIGRAAQGLPHLARAAELYEREYGPDDARLAACLHSLGRALHGTSRFAEAEESLRRALGILSRVVGEGAPVDLPERSRQIAFVLTTLGATVADGRDATDEAEGYFQRALEIRLALYGEESLAVSGTLEALGRLRAGTGREEEALDYLMRARDLAAAALGDDRHPSLAVCLNNIAAVQHHLGRTGEAERLYREVLQIRIDSMGESHPHVAQSYANIAGVRRRLGDLDGASEYLEQASAIAEAAFEGDHLDLALLRLNQGQLALSRRRLDEAAAYFEAARAMQLRLQGPRHSGPAQTAVLLADVYRDTGELDRAAALYEEVIAMRGEGIPTDGADAGSALSHLGDLELSRGNLERAEELLREAVRVQRSRMHDYEAEVFLSRSALIDVLRARGQYGAAADLAEGLVDSQCGLHHGSQLGAGGRIELAFLRYAEGRDDESERLYRDALFELRATAPAGSLADVDALAGLAELLVQTGRSAAAEPLLFEARALLLERGLAGSGMGAEVSYLYGRCLWELGRHAEAEPLLLDAWAQMFDLFGEDSPRSRMNLEGLVSFYRSLGDEERADDMAGLYELLYGVD